MSNFSLVIFALVAVALFASTPSEAFSLAVPTTTSRLSTTSLNGFGKAFGDAFKSDDSLGKAENAGLKGGPKYNEQVTINGKEVKAIVGQPGASGKMLCLLCRFVY